MYLQNYLKMHFTNLRNKFISKTEDNVGSLCIYVDNARLQNERNVTM